MITGGPMFGKTALVKHVLSSVDHGRVPVFVDAKGTDSVWNVLDSFLAGVGCVIPGGLLVRIKTLSFASVRATLTSLLAQVCVRIVTVVDHSENWLDPNGAIHDPDLVDFIGCLARAPGSKVVLTSRKEICSGLPVDSLYPHSQPKVGRFPKGKEDDPAPYVENILTALVAKTDFPAILVKATAHAFR